MRRPDLATLVRSVALPSNSPLGIKVWGIRQLFQSLDTLDVSVEYLLIPAPSYDDQAGSLPNPVALVVYGVRNSKALFPTPPRDQALSLARRIGTSRLRSLTTKDWSLIGGAAAPRGPRRPARPHDPQPAARPGVLAQHCPRPLGPRRVAVPPAHYRRRIRPDGPAEPAARVAPDAEHPLPAPRDVRPCTDIIYLSPPSRPDDDEYDGSGSETDGNVSDADADVGLAAMWLYPELLRDGLPRLRHFELSRGHFPKLVPSGPLSWGSIFTAASFVQAIHDGGLLPALERVTLHGCSFGRPLNEGSNASTWDDVELLQLDAVDVF